MKDFLNAVFDDEFRDWTLPDSEKPRFVEDRVQYKVACLNCPHFTGSMAPTCADCPGGPYNPGRTETTATNVADPSDKN